MWIMLMMMMLQITLFYILMMILPMFNKHKMMDREKCSPFECGFDPFTNSRIPFSIHFFSISLMFLIFDIEISLILPLPLMKNTLKINYWILFSIFMILILIISLFLEWKEGSMEWK